MGALDGEAGGRGCALGVGMQRHQRGDEVETVAHVQGGSEEVSSACRRSADHMVTWMRTPCRAYQHGEELSLAGMHRVGSCPTGGCMETSWQATLLGRGPGERGGALRGLGRRSGGGWDGDAPPLPAGSRCATQLDRPDRMAVAEQVEQLELERDDAQELPMPLRPESVGDGGAEEPEEHEQLSAGTAGRGRDVDGLSATRAGHARSEGEVRGGINYVRDFEI